jgi:hypothetical protein
MPLDTYIQFYLRNTIPLQTGELLATCQEGDLHIRRFLLPDLD